MRLLVLLLLLFAPDTDDRKDNDRKEDNMRRGSVGCK